MRKKIVQIRFWPKIQKKIFLASRKRKQQGNRSGLFLEKKSRRAAFKSNNNNNSYRTTCRWTSWDNQCKPFESITLNCIAVVIGSNKSVTSEMQSEKACNQGFCIANNRDDMYKKWSLSSHLAQDRSNFFEWWEQLASELPLWWSWRPQ